MVLFARADWLVWKWLVSAIHLRAAPETKLRVNNSIFDLYYKNSFFFFLQIQLPKYVLINFDGCGEKIFLLKDIFQRVKVKTGRVWAFSFRRKKNHDRSWIICWEGFNTSTGTLIHLFIHSFIYWLCHSFIDLLITSFVHPFILLFTDSFIRFTQSFINPSFYLYCYSSSDDILLFSPWFIYQFLLRFFFFLINVMLKKLKLNFLQFCSNTSLMILPCGPTW